MATCLTGVVVGVGTVVTDAPSGADVVASPTAGMSAVRLDLSTVADRSRAVSRSAPRVKLEPEAVGKQYATATLNLWSEPTNKSRRFGQLDEGSRVAITGKVVKGWAEVLIEGKVRYVNADYLDKDKPVEAAVTGGASGGGVSTAPCPDGSGTESGLTSTAITMFRAVCNAFPALEVYGGWDPHGEHIDGRAIDFMTYSNSGLGSAVAEWARAHAGELRIRTVIFAQKIWIPERASEGWRYMEDRGSTTANHYDHVHVSVY